MKRRAESWPLNGTGARGTLEEVEQRSCPPISRAPGDLHKDNGGVCMMNTAWRDGQHPSFVNFILSFLSANSYRLNFLPIAPDFIFNNGGVSVAFIFLTNWDCDNTCTVFSRVDKLKRQFGHFYVVVSIPTREQNDSFNRSYFKYVLRIVELIFSVEWMSRFQKALFFLRYILEPGSPTFVAVCDPEMGFEKIVKIAHARGVCKRQDAVSMMKLERDQAVQRMDLFLKVVTSIPGIDNHDANALAQAVGSVEAISKASKSFILENTDLSVDKAERIVRFFRDSKYYLSPKIN